ncbi:MAG: hypothetical protein KC483_10770 [Nitrosarchaeum sp.]|nr:hypothetical protein [Nitrosarchaeum sp.]
MGAKITKKARKELITVTAAIIKIKVWSLVSPELNSPIIAFKMFIK